VGKPRPHRGKVLALTFSLDGKHLITGCGRRPDAREDEEGVVHFYSLDRTDRHWKHVLNCPATAVAISPDGKLVVGGGYDVLIWDSATGKEIGRGENTESTALAVFDPRVADEFMVCNPSGSLGLFHCRENNPANRSEHLSPQGWVVGVGYRPDGLIFTANLDGTIRLWHRPKRTFDLHTFRPARGKNGVLCIDFRPDGQAVALGTRDGFVYYYPALDGSVPSTELLAAVGGVKRRRSQIIDVRFSADGRRIFAQNIHLRNFAFELNKANSSLSINSDCLALANDGRTSLQKNAKQDTYNLRDISTGQSIGRPFTIPGLRWPPIPTIEVDDEFLLR